MHAWVTSEARHTLILTENKPAYLPMSSRPTNVNSTCDKMSNRWCASRSNVLSCSPGYQDLLRQLRLPLHVPGRPEGPTMARDGELDQAADAVAMASRAATDELGQKIGRRQPAHMMAVRQLAKWLIAVRAAGSP